MLAGEARVTWETCLRGETASTSGTTSEEREAASARGESRVPHHSFETPQIGVEQRRGCHAEEESKSKGERSYGPEGVALTTLPETAAGVGELQRTLYRPTRSGDRPNKRRVPAHEANWPTASESRTGQIRLCGPIRGGGRAV
jgi:hypothetical protein